MIHGTVLLCLLARWPDQQAGIDMPSEVVVVTGASGYIACHLVQQLLEKGEVVWVRHRICVRARLSRPP
jgi:3-oxoacyl-ACP reductase-like protein